MNAKGPSLKSGRHWAKREAKYLAILERALLLLRVESDLPEAENELNLRLFFCLLKASRELYPEDDISPVQECNNQPDPDDDARATRLHKRPDFQWCYLDKYEADPIRSQRQFVVECKRLGKVSGSWIFNTNYVERGICRFHDHEWAYAKRFESGAMVGYWQNMASIDIFNEVNGILRKNGLPALVLNGTWKENHVSKLKHGFLRAFEISPFRLEHLWVDIRNRKANRQRQL